MNKAEVECDEPQPGGQGKQEPSAMSLGAGHRSTTDRRTSLGTAGKAYHDTVMA